MKRISLSLKASLVGAFALLLLVMAGQGLFALSSLGRVYADVQALATNWVPSVDIINKINITMADLRGRRRACSSHPTRPPWKKPNRRLAKTSPRFASECRPMRP